MENCRPNALFRAANTTRAWAHLMHYRYPWEILDPLRQIIAALGRDLPAAEFEERGEGIFISRRASVADSACIHSPCIIEEGAQVRHGAFLRGGTLIGRGAVVGNSCELKNCILFDGVQVPHFNYVGDSILGFGAHLGAGAITSNVKCDRSEVYVRVGEQRFPTGRKKLGAMLGDGVEVGCNAVLNPGTVVGIGTRIYPLCSVRGYIPPQCILKGSETVRRRDAGMRGDAGDAGDAGMRGDAGDAGDAGTRGRGDAARGLSRKPPLTPKAFWGKDKKTKG